MTYEVVMPYHLHMPSYFLGTFTEYPKVKPLKNSGFTFQFVELEGIEPSSKRGNHKLSTCLSLPDFSCNGRTKAINRCLIL